MPVEKEAPYKVKMAVSTQVYVTNKFLFYKEELWQHTSLRQMQIVEQCVV